MHVIRLSHTWNPEVPVAMTSHAMHRMLPDLDPATLELRFVSQKLRARPIIIYYFIMVRAIKAST